MNVPADLADGDAVLSEGQVEGFVTNGSLDLASGTTLNGQQILTSVQCNVGEVLSYDGLGWSCTSQSMLDADGDGAMAWSDCDDND